MLKAERQSVIIRELQKNNKIRTKELASHLQLSEDTVRRDLNELHQKQQLIKVYGGAVSYHPDGDDYLLNAVSLESQKEIIGNKAIKLLQDNQVIIMSGGTTNLVLAKLLPSHLKLTVYTYSLPIALQLCQHPNIELILIGGKMQKNAKVTVGIDVIQVLSKIRADICFLGVSSINLKHGLTEIGYEVSIVKKAMIAASDKVVTLFTSNKLNTKMAHTVCGLSELDTMVTELDPKDKRLTEYQNAGVRIL